MKKEDFKNILKRLTGLGNEGAEIAEELSGFFNHGELLCIPFPRGEWAWHIYRMSKTNSKKGWTKRLVPWEQIVAGIAKDSDGIYVKYRDNADRVIKQLKEKDNGRNF